jgi:plastocyanin
MAGPRHWMLAGAAALLAIAVFSCSDRPDPLDPIADCFQRLEVDGPAVAMRNFEFLPDTLRVSVGDRVTWVNCEDDDVDPHTTTSDIGVWGSEFLFPGDTFAREFDQAGDFPYHCVPHADMEAVIVVEP